VFIEALIDAGVHVGLSREDAHQLAVQTVLGAAKIIDQNREHPAVWKSRVTTPAGTTAAGLFELEQGKFRSIINAAVIAATERAQELAYA
jgi:pyrroline-5-carboxylate reductase